MLKIVKQQLHSWWWPVPLKTPVAECRYQSILPVKENIKLSGCKKSNSFFAFLKSFSVCHILQFYDFKSDNFKVKHFDIFSYLSTKHRLSELVRILTSVRTLLLRAKAKICTTR